MAQRELPPPKNRDVLERLANPLPRNITKKFSAILDEEKQATEKHKTIKKKKSSVKPCPPPGKPPKSSGSAQNNHSVDKVDEISDKTVEIKLNDQVDADDTTTRS